MMQCGGNRFVVIGGGIAGVTCVETLSFIEENAPVTLISASPLIKTVTNYEKVTRVGETFDVEEKPLSFAKESNSNINVIQAAVTGVNTKEKTVALYDGTVIHYDKLCICTGGRPRVIAPQNPFVVGIRDTESVKDFQQKIRASRRILIVGNGGIATELVYELEGCEVVWAIKDKSIAHTFVDAGAGEFFTEHLNKEKDNTPAGPSKRLKYTRADVSQACGQKSSDLMGGALGPDWIENLEMRGAKQQVSHLVHVEKQVEVIQVLTSDEFKKLAVDETKISSFDGGGDDKESKTWSVYVKLTNDKIYGCDLVVSATGVEPFTDPVLSGNSFDLAEDGGLKVNDHMQTSEPDVYAAGDVCTACWETSPHWLQMRLWSQARQMGCYAAKCMAADSKGEEISLDFCFELFAHVTTFFKYKVILLGRFNGQGLGEDQEILLRVTKGQEYVKVILHDGKLVGAILIGETDLEETFENLILNGMDLTPFKDNLLEPGIDIDDFFD